MDVFDRVTQVNTIAFSEGWAIIVGAEGHFSIQRKGECPFNSDNELLEFIHRNADTNRVYREAIDIVVFQGESW